MISLHRFLYVSLPFNHAFKINSQCRRVKLTYRKIQEAQTAIQCAGIKSFYLLYACISHLHSVGIWCTVLLRFLLFTFLTFLNFFVLISTFFLNLHLCFELHLPRVHHIGGDFLFFVLFSYIKPALFCHMQFLSCFVLQPTAQVVMREKLPTGSKSSRFHT